MFAIFRKRRIEKYTKEAAWYTNRNYEPAEQKEEKTPPIRFSLSPVDEPKQKVDEEVQFSLKKPESENKPAPIRYSISDPDDIPIQGDLFQLDTVDRLFAKYATSSKNFSNLLDANLNLSFTDMLMRYINMKQWRDSKVYKAAQMDRRLFSKIMSDREYKPSKDTALALAIGLELSLQQTNDLLSRAGYTLSHSCKRDVIIEYFIREGVHNLMDINEVLLRMEQKIIGR